MGGDGGDNTTGEDEWDNCGPPMLKSSMDRSSDICVATPLFTIVLKFESQKVPSFTADKQT